MNVLFASNGRCHLFNYESRVNTNIQIKSKFTIIVKKIGKPTSFKSIPE